MSVDTHFADAQCWQPLCYTAPRFSDRGNAENSMPGRNKRDWRESNTSV